MGLLCQVRVSKNDAVFFFFFHFYFSIASKFNSFMLLLFCFFIETFKLATQIYFFLFQRNRIVARQIATAIVVSMNNKLSFVSHPGVLHLFVSIHETVAG